MVVDKNCNRKRTLCRLRLAMRKDRADPEKISKWFKVMECKKNIFSLEDEISKLTNQIKNKPA